MRHGWLILFLSLVLSLGAAACNSGPDWGMPAAAKDAPNPVPATAQNLAAAQAIYADRCARCHGDHGAGDGPDASLYKPLPSELDRRHDAPNQRRRAILEDRQGPPADARLRKRAKRGAALAAREPSAHVRRAACGRARCGAAAPAAK